ncbi:MAG: hypothetical protein ABIR84_13980 [Candidatus Nitrotoga sp.]
MRLIFVHLPNIRIDMAANAHVDFILSQHRQIKPGVVLDVELSDAWQIYRSTFAPK